jgi:hypothetical protein
MHSNRAIPPVASDTDTCPVDVEKMATWIADECRCHPRWFAPLSDCRGVGRDLHRPASVKIDRGDFNGRAGVARHELKP